MKTVLVTGASGQLGSCLQKIADEYSQLDFLFMSSSEVDITSKCELEQLFAAKEINYCINCAAYTNVEKAEEEQEKTFNINAEGVKNLAKICKKNDAVLLHISTDYVFDGKASQPYSEEDETNPINVYGASKLKGEEYIRNILHDYFIFRTSWLYSEFGHNFFRTILRKAEEGAELNITTSQKGTPTNANDLARLLLEIISEESNEFGLYHFSNLGEATWFDFAKSILELSGKEEQVQLNESNNYRTVAARPAYSLLNKSKVEETFHQPLLTWEDSLRQLIESRVKTE